MKNGSAYAMNYNYRTAATPCTLELYNCEYSL